MPKLKPSPAITGITAYSVPRPEIPVDLYLHGNEGPAPTDTVLDALGERGVDLLRDYPNAKPLEELIAEREGVDREQVIVTAGADDALDRICRALLAPGRNMVLPEPTFVMFRRFAARAGGEVVSVPWEGPEYPTEAVLDAIDDQTTLVAIVSPNNPTGAVATADDVRRIAEAAPHALVIVDHAYVEFGEENLTQVALEYPNTVVTRTMSKAWGMAGVRVGYALSSPQVIDWMHTAGLPYAVSGPSLAFVARRLEEGDARVASFVERVKEERGALEARLSEAGLRVTPSQGNFVFARTDDALWVRDALAGMGIMVRAFPGNELLDDALRITCPGDEANFERLQHAIDTIFAPESILFDLDGVLADVSQSYRKSIVATAESFGVELTPEDISEAKAAGDANNDWILTRRMLAERGVEASLDEVTERFEQIYQGTEEEPGLRRTESLLCESQYLASLAERYKLGIVTGRPRKDAERFLSEKGIAEYFGAVVCMEDAKLKPDPEPVELLLEGLDARTGWLVGDTPDDAKAARGARVLPIGMIAPGHDHNVLEPALTRSGCAVVLHGVDELEEYLP
ncbi:aminotransferase class I/II-fold pyridoxal phosphate-dependent enzyme [Persicimonas caeni]|uniref:histidinol-phosphate transaminase n=1 Tax=Persicimonas caeni TaxID=2292766 RepID=A0A4Y6Q440_PERCE|nr:aminotransferase class I/II-fold pyridoxal phosphate-dependent enzyme [Persicimonas caeni]QDG54755.1 aminotransferase class I/II-fold pyridoxal phosphate-dependent enzyme [Persicimonas caeni]QED35976.1 aminotransferase class I/II-fold pyridoxal phosphate-dependent enzyme [Persicimonas caeni]